MQDTNVTTVLMVRHADVHNPNKIVYGRLGRFGLSELGRSQAYELATFLTGVPISAIYSSPQLRARQTAAIVNEQGHCHKIHISRLLAEVLTGYQGQVDSILASKNFNFYDKLARPDDETIAMIGSRTTRFLERIRGGHEGQTVVAVSHADVIMILRASVLGMPLVINSLRGRYYPAKCSITQFSFPPGASRPIVVYRAPVKDESTNNSSNAKAEENERKSEGGDRTDAA